MLVWFYVICFHVVVFAVSYALYSNVSWEDLRKTIKLFWEYR